MRSLFKNLSLKGATLTEGKSISCILFFELDGNYYRVNDSFYPLNDNPDLTDQTNYQAPFNEIVSPTAQISDYSMSQGQFNIIRINLERIFKEVTTYPKKFLTSFNPLIRDLAKISLETPVYLAYNLTQTGEVEQGL